MGANKVANMLTIYIEEAHAADDWSLPPGRLTGFGASVKMAKSIDDRIYAAKKFVDELKYPVEMVCDSMNGDALLHYEAWPERLYIIEDGVVVFRGGLGPHDYRPNDVKDWLTSRFARK
jgi:type I thyroxine 5'-deiodinase